MRTFMLGLMLTVVPCAAHAQEERTAEKVPTLSEMAAKLRKEVNVPAVGLGVMLVDGKPQVAVDGIRVVGSDAKVSNDDLWHYGSITKSFTATLVARLVEKKVVSWDDTIGKLLGDKVPDMRDEYRNVTLVHLLAHRGGLQPNIPLSYFGSFAAEPSDRIADRLRWTKIVLKQEPIGPKEKTYVYANNGYIVVGAMLEAATGKSWEDLMRKEVFEPLGLKSAGFGPPRGDTPDAQPRGHVGKGADRKPVPQNADNPPAFGPAGRVHMSLRDMLVYLHAHATKQSDFLSNASYEKLHTVPFGGFYALGWIAPPGSDGRFHNGSNTMWYAEAGFNEKTGTAAVVAANDGDIKGLKEPVRAVLKELMNRGK